MKKSKLYKHIEKEIKSIKKPSIIGINGANLSGKTVFSQELIAFLNEKGHKTQLICMDDFYNTKEIRMKDNTPECYYQNAINTKKFVMLISEIIMGSVNKTISLLNTETDEYSNEKTFKTNMDTIVIVEGILLYKPPIDALFDYKIYLDITEEELLKRGKEINIPQFGEKSLEIYHNLFIPVQKLYENSCKPQKNCDLLIDNNNFENPEIM